MSTDRANVRYAAIWWTVSAIERRNYWAELSIWSKRRLGELIAEGQENGSIESHGGDRKSSLHDGDLITPDAIAPSATRTRAKQVAAIPEGTVREYAKAAREAGELLIKLPKDKGGRPSDKKTGNTTLPVSKQSQLDDLGITQRPIPSRPRVSRAKLRFRDLAATEYACGANSEHGYRRTNKDKRRAVETG